MNKEQLKLMLIYESFIRRASELKWPFMLKGSYLTRQYFPDPKQRVPGDLDWHYLERLDDPGTSRAIFDEWLMGITEQETTDGVKFRDFRENAFWRRIDYAMADDFPTVNTDLSCWVDDELVDAVGLDISFNLPVDYPPVPMLYKPLRGAPFTIPYTVPIALQVSWKIHQTLVRPRFKDLFDLTYLLKHPAFDEQALHQALQALLEESNKDRVDLLRFDHFLTQHMEELFHIDILAMWDCWRNNIYSPATKNVYMEHAEELTDVNTLPYNLSEFLDHFYLVLNAAGFKPAVIDADLEDKWHYKTDYQTQKLLQRARTAEARQEEQGIAHEPLKNSWLDRLRRFFRGKS